jgi:hypothetical protein
MSGSDAGTFFFGADAVRVRHQNMKDDRSCEVQVELLVASTGQWVSPHDYGLESVMCS